MAESLKRVTDLTPLLDPELVEAFRTLPNRGGPIDAPARRVLSRQFAALLRARLPPTDDLSITDHVADGVPVRVIAPRERPDQARRRSVLLWMHGGGFFTGHHEDEDLITAPWVRELGITAVSVGYRLAPEHPHPAASDDCFAALKWLASGAAPLGFVPERIAVGGISAGGALAAATALRARDQGGPRLVLQLLLVPCTDNRSHLPSMLTLDDPRSWHRDANVQAWRMYAGGDGEVSPYAAPNRAADLANLPPAYFEVAGADPLRDEAIAYATRLMQAGVPTELHVFPGAAHGSTYVLPAAKVSARARAEALQVLRTALA